MNPDQSIVLVNQERTVLVRLWGSGQAEYATRPDPDAVWGPPQFLEARPVTALSWTPGGAPGQTPNQQQEA